MHYPAHIMPCIPAHGPLTQRLTGGLETLQWRSGGTVTGQVNGRMPRDIIVLAIQVVHHGLRTCEQPQTPPPSVHFIVDCQDIYSLIFRATDCTDIYGLVLWSAMLPGDIIREIFVHYVNHTEMALLALQGPISRHWAAAMPPCNPVEVCMLRRALLRWARMRHEPRRRMVSWAQRRYPPHERFIF